MIGVNLTLLSVYIIVAMESFSQMSLSMKVSFEVIFVFLEAVWLLTYHCFYLTECDPTVAMPEGVTCETVGGGGTYTGGILGCYYYWCQFDTSGCINENCGNGVIDNNEMCGESRLDTWNLSLAFTSENEHLTMLFLSFRHGPVCSWLG